MSAPESVATLNFSRPVLKTESLPLFMVAVRTCGAAEDAFGIDLLGGKPRPEGVVLAADGTAYPTEEHTGYEIPRLRVYQDDDLELSMVQWKAPTYRKVDYLSKFHNAARRIMNNPQVMLPEYRSHPVDVEDDEKLTSFERLMAAVGHKYDVSDQTHIDVPCNDLLLPVDSVAGKNSREVYLLADTGSVIGQMLVEQAAWIEAALLTKNRELFNLRSPTAIGIPFARLPRTATPQAIENFTTCLRKELPVKLTLGPVGYTVTATAA